MWLRAGEEDTRFEPELMTQALQAFALRPASDNGEPRRVPAVGKKSECSNGIVRTFASLEPGGRDEQGKLAETEVGSRLLLREWRKNVRVDPIRNDVPEGGLQAVRAPCVIELPFRGHHPDAGPEAIQLAMLEPHAEEPDEALRFPDLRADVARFESP